MNIFLPKICDCFYTVEIYDRFCTLYGYFLSYTTVKSGYLTILSTSVGLMVVIEATVRYLTLANSVI